MVHCDVKIIHKLHFRARRIPDSETLKRTKMIEKVFNAVVLITAITIFTFQRSCKAKVISQSEHQRPNNVKNAKPSQDAFRQVLKRSHQYAAIVKRLRRSLSQRSIRAGLQRASEPGKPQDTAQNHVVSQLSQYDMLNPDLRADQLPDGVRSENANIPPEVITLFGGNVPSEVVSHFNGLIPQNQNQPVLPPLNISRPQPEFPPTDQKYPHQQAPSENNIRNQPMPHPSDLPPVSFGQFNYDYILKPPSICVGAKNETSDTEEEVITTAAPIPDAPPDPNIPLTAKQKETILREHNRYRSGVDPEASDMRLITWDDELSWVSQTFTNSCYYRDIVEPRSFHPNGSQVSPAIELKRHSYLTSEIGHTWFAWPRTFRIPPDFATASLSAWESEKAFYDDFAQQCDGVCEHYLQLIWAETFKMGCSAAWCEEPKINDIVWPQAIIFVCSYTPRGGIANFMAASPRLQFLDPKLFIEPYQKGKSCSLCVLNPNDPDQNLDHMRSTTDKCWNKLCANEKERDKIIPFVPPVRTTTRMWIMTPSTTTTKSHNINGISHSEVIEIQLDNDEELVIEDSGGVMIKPRLQILVPPFIFMLRLFLFP